MRVIRHHILPWLMVLLVVMTGQAAAVAHAAPGPSGQIELCTGSGPVMVYVDADGQPIGDPVYCPDFALSLILALDLPPVVAAMIQASGVPAEGPRPVLPVRSRNPMVRGARGPPVTI